MIFNDETVKNNFFHRQEDNSPIFFQVIFQNLTFEWIIIDYKFMKLAYMLMIALYINCGVSEDSYNKLKTELNQCNIALEDARNTPQVRLSKALQFQEEKKIENAKKEFREIINKFPNTDESTKASIKLKEIELAEKKEKEEEERRRLLGFKILKENFTKKVGDITLNFTAFNSSNTFTFDSYDDTYYSKTAERGNIYLTSRISISSDSKDPDLPPIALYSARAGELSLLGLMEYRFVWWESFGAYLGTDAAYANDFSRTKTIAFNAGLQVELNDFNNYPIFTVIKNKGCFTKNNNSYGSPRIRYEENKCEMKSSLKLEDFDSEYTLIKIFNKGKL